MENTVLSIWRDNKGFFETKTVEQIITFCGDGKLKDGNTTSIEFRNFLANISTEYLRKYAEECLSNTFNNGGLILQDIINEIGRRLSFSVENGVYRGTRSKKTIGFDGIWRSNNGYEMVVEVKTTDAYRINLDTIAEYRNQLIESKSLDKRNSSILIVVGRQDTGDLEAQIRGSKHAWDVRLISTDALIKLTALKENLNDTRTSQQINEILKPMEFTKVDPLINIIFNTTEDVQIEVDTDLDNQIEGVEEIIKNNTKKEKLPIKKALEFKDECVNRIEKTIRRNLIKQGRSLYSSVDGNYHAICVISKEYKLKNSRRYWFAFHPYQKEILSGNSNTYITFGCGTPHNTFLIPYKDFEICLDRFNKTHRDNGSFYWHVEIYKRGNTYTIRQNHSEDFEINKYLLKKV